MSYLKFPCILLTLLLISLLVSQVSALTVFSISQLEGHFLSQLCWDCIPDCNNNMCVKQCDSRIKRIANLTGIDFNQKPISKNKLGITKVSFASYNITDSYLFPSKQYFVHNVGYTIIRPNVDQKNFKGVIGYFQAPILDKSLVGSNKGKIHLSLAGLYASQGYIVIIPDYIGNGNNSQMSYPSLLFPQINAMTMRNVLKKAYTQIINVYPNLLRISLNLAGYSEGAASALWFNYCQNQTIFSINSTCKYFDKLDWYYTLNKIAGMQGTYDVKGTMIPFLTSRVSKSTQDNKYNIFDSKTTSFVKPSLAAMLMTSFASHSGTGTKISDVFVKGFYEMRCQDPNDQDKCNIGGKQSNLEMAFKGKNNSQPEFIRSLAMSAFGKVHLNSKYMTKTEWEQIDDYSFNSIYAFVNEDVLRTKQFYDLVQQATLVNRTYPKPEDTFIFSLEQDSIVSSQNSKNLKASNPSINQLFFKNEDLPACGSVQANMDHLNAEILANLYALKFFTGQNQQRINKREI